MHHGAKQFRRGLGHFVIGKAGTAACSITLLIILARTLPKADYAIYVTLQAIVMTVGYVTSFGINQTVLRYAPELRAAGQHAALYRLVWRSLWTLGLATGAGFALLAMAQSWLTDWFDLRERQGWVILYFGAGLFRLTGYFLSRVMEALLWQKISQYSLAAAALGKLSLVLLLAGNNHLGLPALVSIELAVEAATLLALMLGLRHNIARDPLRDAGHPGWLAQHRSRMQAYGRWTYVAALFSQLGSSSPYRLLAASLLVSDSTALLGFVYSVTDMLYRFMPAILGQVVIRSVLIARLTQGEGPERLVAWLGLSLRVNATLLGLFVLGSAAVGDSAAAALTAGKYRDAGLLLAALGCVLLLDMLRLQLETLAQVTEHARWTLYGNIALATGVVAAGLAVPSLGLWALPLGAGIGQLAAIAVYQAGLARLGTARIADARILLFLALAGLAAAALRLLGEGQPWWLMGCAALVLSLVLLVAIRPFGFGEWKALRMKVPLAPPSR
jgi:O-antigen/teichoic acid export membrane protein